MMSDRLGGLLAGLDQLAGLHPIGGLPVGDGFGLLAELAAEEDNGLPTLSTQVEPIGLRTNDPKGIATGSNTGGGLLAERSDGFRLDVHR